ncbi:hypothetical protein HETIRDRAFT_165988 [Heterobasidion irregulare TC 32-1]|uniref:Uncharacterized protein n=1 Tax=Heterobasidion irregulare (strain TC 32-1) TaxID=747525 RepID=W4KKU3_HETIT|nr:uncharacterized protein HETIRDRAFT_165988 [Heterobasidion irregulare TC 32-1]ETW86473.1 hypothetical protein HETIRDRAFT_165988 [Heterobasidion irregulare TC 32-1]
MIASEIICDDTYPYNAWCTVSQGVLTLREINQMECEMCSYLGCQINVKPSVLCNFEPLSCSCRRPPPSRTPSPPHLHLLPHVWPADTLQHRQGAGRCCVAVVSYTPLYVQVRVDLLVTHVTRRHFLHPPHLHTFLWAAYILFQVYAARVHALIHLTHTQFRDAHPVALNLDVHPSSHAPFTSASTFRLQTSFVGFSASTCRRWS